MGEMRGQTLLSDLHCCVTDTSDDFKKEKWPMVWPFQKFKGISAQAQFGLSAIATRNVPRAQKPSAARSCDNARVSESGGVVMGKGTAERVKIAN